MENLDSCYRQPEKHATNGQGTKAVQQKSCVKSNKIPCQANYNDANCSTERCDDFIAPVIHFRISCVRHSPTKLNKIDKTTSFYGNDNVQCEMSSYRLINTQKLSRSANTLCSGTRLSKKESCIRYAAASVALDLVHF
jgi:hypothetical protein